MKAVAKPGYAVFSHVVEQTIGQVEYEVGSHGLFNTVSKYSCMVQSRLTEPNTPSKVSGIFLAIKSIGGDDYFHTSLSL